jgi:hypothetical protein
MKSVLRIAIGLAALGGFSIVRGQVLLTDDFAGSSLDTSKWTASTRVAGAAVSVNNALVLTDGGSVLTATEFPSQIQIDLLFQFTGSQYDSFKIDTRTNGGLFQNSGEFVNGLRLSIRMMSDPSDSAGTTNNVELDDVQNGSQYVQLGVATVPIYQGQTNFVRIVESISIVNVYINDFTSAAITVADSAAYGNHIGLNNREGAAAGSSVSDGSQVTIKAFSVTATNPHLVNISTRGFVGTGPQIVIGGFVVAGSNPETVLLRGIGPALAQFGVTGTLTTPQLTLFDSTGAVIASNIGWSNSIVTGPSSVNATARMATVTDFSQAGAFHFPAGTADCAMVAVLPPGIYTAQLTGTGSTTGIGLVEAYELSQ